MGIIKPINGGGAVDSVNGQVGVVVLDTGDIAEITDKNYVSDAELTVISNTTGINTGDETQSSIIQKIGFTPLAPSGSGAGLTGVLTSSLDMDTANCASNTPSFTVTNANTRTKVNNFAPPFDNISSFNATTQKIIVKKNGYHSLHVRVYPDTNITGNIELSYYLNGSNYGGAYATCASNQASAQANFIRNFSVNDEIEIYVSCSVAGTVLHPYFIFEWRGVNT